MYFQSWFFFLSFCPFFLHLCGEACQCSGIRHCVVNTTVKQTAVKFLLIDLQSLAMSSWRHSMSSRALWVILACGSAIDRARPPGVKKSEWRVSKKPRKKTLRLILEKWWKTSNCGQIPRAALLLVSISASKHDDTKYLNYQQDYSHQFAELLLLFAQKKKRIEATLFSHWNFIFFLWIQYHCFGDF